MPTDLTCAKCGRYFQVAELDSGQLLECPACGAIHDPAALVAELPPAPTPEHELGQRRDLEPHRGPTIMVLGIISLIAVAMFPLTILGIPLGIIAWVMGRNDLKKIKAKQMDPEGESNTNAGRLCGIIGALICTSVVLLMCGIYSLMFGMIFALRAAPPGGRLPPTSKTGSAPVENRAPAREEDRVMPLEKDQPFPP